MRRHVPGLHSRQSSEEYPLEGLFLVRVEWVSYRWHPQKAYLSVRFVVLEPKPFERRSFSGRLYCTDRALWKLNWFLRDFGYDQEMLAQDQVDVRALLNLRGIVRTSYVTLAGQTFQNLEAFATAADWEELACAEVGGNGSDKAHGL